MKSHKFTKCLLLAIAASGMQTNAQTALADSTESSPQPVIGITDPTTIKNLAAAAYVWSLPAEYTYRFSKYNELVTAPANTLKYFSDPALWNNAATNAGNPSALYIYGTFDLTLQDLVFTIPATDKTFSLFAFYDNFTNTIANPGTRTTPSSVATTYLLVGPNSEYADKKNVRLKGFNYQVIASDTYRAQMLARIGVNALAPASNPANPVIRIKCESIAAPATPMTRLRIETRPSLAPNTPARRAFPPIDRCLPSSRATALPAKPLPCPASILKIRACDRSSFGIPV